MPVSEQALRWAGALLEFSRLNSLIEALREQQVMFLVEVDSLRQAVEYALTALT